MQEELELKKHIDQEIQKKASTVQKKNYELSLQMKNVNILIIDIIKIPQ